MSTWIHNLPDGDDHSHLPLPTQLTQKVKIQQAPCTQCSSSKEEVLVLVVAVLFTVSLVVPASNILLSDLF